MTQFTNYNDSIFDAFCLHTKRKEIIDRKEEIINKVGQHHNLKPNSILFVGFNPAILSIKAKEVYVTQVSGRVFAWLQTQRADVKLYQEPRQFDFVVAFDEYLTFSQDEQAQKTLISEFCRHSTGLAITTVKDYKNQDFKDKEYSQPAIVRHDDKVTAFTEIHNWHPVEKNSWQTSLYELSGAQAACKGVYDRRSLYFKQLAKFSIDAGAKNFLVHKNMMYKSIIKKNYEHIISITF
jgi:hypothetical protein